MDFEQAIPVATGMINLYGKYLHPEAQEVMHEHIIKILTAGAPAHLLIDVLDGARLDAYIKEQDNV